MDPSNTVAYATMEVPSRRSKLREKINKRIPSSSKRLSVSTTISAKTTISRIQRYSTSTGYEATTSDLSCKTWDGQTRTAMEWNGLRKDPELWFPKGNCLVHLYEYGQSKRGPSFRVHLDTLVEYNCWPLLNRYMRRNGSDSPVSESGSSDDGSYFDQSNSKTYELYIPAPKSAERDQAFLYHSTTRNFFAWLFGKSLVGTNLGGALVGLLNSMNEFRSSGLDNVQAIMDYMDDEGYADMRNSPDHALAILFFAEHFQFKDLWTDAFAHCTGMHEILVFSAGFECMSRTSRAFITRSKMEMNIRLDFAGRNLSNFLSDELSDTHLGLSSAGRDHLDKFRTFLHSYYVAKLGYYPPASASGANTAYPKEVYAQMCAEFQKLYGYLVDFNYTSPMTLLPRSQQGGICILQTLQAFDARHKYSPLLNQLPLLPEPEDIYVTKSHRSKRMTWYKPDKMKPDPRLITLSSMMKATNQSPDMDGSLVRAYRGFEKDCILPPTNIEKSEKLSPTDARKVRWILIYSILQTLISVTSVPSQVRDTQNVPYNLCVLTAGTPPWKEKQPIEALRNTQIEKPQEDFITTLSKATDTAETPSSLELKPDIDYFAITHRPPPCRDSKPALISKKSKKGSIKQALSTLGHMPELRHPTPTRPVFHEILVQGYGNGTNEIAPPTTTLPPTVEELVKKASIDSSASSNGGLSSRWSQSSMDPTDLSSSSRRASDDSSRQSILEIEDFLTSSESIRKLSMGEIEDQELQPNPLRLSKVPDLSELVDDYMTANAELEVYLTTP